MVRNLLKQRFCFFQRTLEKKGLQQILPVADAVQFAAHTESPLQQTFSHSSPSSPNIAPLTFSLHSEQLFDDFLAVEPPEKHR